MGRLCETDGVDRATKADSRASRGAIDKRRAARRFNEVLLSGAGSGHGRDGRTEKRRQRLLKELADGKAKGGKQELKPIDVLLRVQALLSLGESVASIKKARRVPRPVAETDDLIDGVRRLHEAYDFAEEVYQFVGISPETLARAVKGPGVRAAGRNRASKRGAA
jgi:hypothetical protein